VFGTAGVALVTFVCFRLQIALAIVALLYLIIVVLLSATDGIVPSVSVSIIAVLCLNYFFTQPLFSLRVYDPLDIAASIGACCTALSARWLLNQPKREAGCAGGNFFTY
jgi:two-component system, LuxR family, sensor kinase FixL